MIKSRKLRSLGIAYGSVSFFLVILHNIFLLYYVQIFVTVYRIDKLSFWIGETIFLLWNSFNDPLFGWMSDKNLTNVDQNTEFVGRWVVLKRVRSLRVSGPLFAISFLSFWFQWPWTSLQFVFSLCLYDSFLTMLDLHHNALLADLVLHDKERSDMNSYCSMFSGVATVSVFLSYTVWNQENLRSFQVYCTCLAVLALVGFILSTKTMERIYMDLQCKDDRDLLVSVSVDKVSNKSSFKPRFTIRDYISQLKKHKNFQWFALMNFVQVFHCHFNNNFFPLFLETLLGDAGKSPILGSFLLWISFLVPHLNNLYFLSVCNKYGVYSVIKGLFYIKLLLSVGMFMAGPDHIWLLCVFIASNRVFTEGICKLLSLAISDLVDEDCILHKRSGALSALVFGTASFLSKPGQTLAPLVGTWLLALQTGHDIFSSFGVSRTDLQLRQVGCFNCLVWVGIICAFIQILTWSQFTLHGKRLERIKALRSNKQEFTNV